jgi:hypothetical protein
VKREIPALREIACTIESDWQAINFVIFIFTRGLKHRERQKRRRGTGFIAIKKIT